jgi:hypothetical protein
MPTQPLDAIPLWALILGVVALLWGFMEIGYRYGKWRHALHPDERDQSVGALVASILALVGLVLAFTFSLAAGRFDDRRLVVLEEANAIGTAYLRARLLPEPERTEVARLLREYVVVRIRGVQEGKPDEAIARSEALHDQLWTAAASAATKNEQSIMTGVFIQALNNVIDVHSKRVMLGLRSRIPVVIWAGVFGLALLGTTAVGYQAALTTSRRSPAMIGLILTFAVVFWIITDLDRGQQGLLQISQRSMLDLQRSMQSATDAEQPGIQPTSQQR